MPTQIFRNSRGQDTFSANNSVPANLRSQAREICFGSVRFDKGRPQHNSQPDGTLLLAWEHYYSRGLVSLEPDPPVALEGTVRVYVGMTGGLINDQFI